MAQGKIEVGDVVRIPSHLDFKMTVYSIDGNYANCVWFSPQGTILAQDFPIQALELVNKKPS